MILLLIIIIIVIIIIHIIIIIIFSRPPDFAVPVCAWPPRAPGMGRVGLLWPGPGSARVQELK